MFAGIIQHVGVVRERSDTAAGARLRIDLGPLAPPLVLGASVAINGVCLTLVEKSGEYCVFDVIHETLRRTTLGDLRPGKLVNLESSLRLGDPIDGHIVQGHVDAVGRVQRVIEERGEFRLWVECPDDIVPFVIPKGAIAIDGVSLTIAEVEGRGCCVALIPATLERTCLRDRGVGDRVNLESDILARTVVHRLNAIVSSPTGLSALRQPG